MNEADGVIENVFAAVNGTVHVEHEQLFVPQHLNGRVLIAHFINLSFSFKLIVYF
jgi:hypothetical protein